MGYHGKLGLTKTIASSGVVSTAGKSARVWAITLRSGTAASALTILNGGSGGAETWKVTLIATTAAGDQCHTASFHQPIICSTDAYATISGTGATATILYDEAGS